MRILKWVVIVLVGSLVWLELFTHWPLESVLLLLAIAGWWDYQRRRGKLTPRDD